MTPFAACRWWCTRAATLRRVLLLPGIVLLHQDQLLVSRANLRSETALNLLRVLTGDERICYGTDAPYDMADFGLMAASRATRYKGRSCGNARKHMEI